MFFIPISEISEWICIVPAFLPSSVVVPIMIGKDKSLSSTDIWEYPFDIPNTSAKLTKPRGCSFALDHSSPVFTSIFSSLDAAKLFNPFFKMLSNATALVPWNKLILLSHKYLHVLGFVKYNSAIESLLWASIWLLSLWLMSEEK